VLVAAAIFSASGTNSLELLPFHAGFVVLAGVGFARLFA